MIALALVMVCGLMGGYYGLAAMFGRISTVVGFAILSVAAIVSCTILLRVQSMPLWSVNLLLASIAGGAVLQAVPRTRCLISRKG